MIMHVINSLIRLKFLLVITGVFVGCSQQTIPLAVLDKNTDILPPMLQLSEREPTDEQLQSKGVLCLDGNCYIVNKEGDAIKTIGGLTKTSDCIFTRCQNFTLYSFFTNWPEYYPIVGECSLGHYIMQARQEIFCGGGYDKVKNNSREWSLQGCFAIPYEGRLNVKNTATIKDDAPFMLDSVTYFGNKVNEWLTQEYAIRDIDGNVVFQIRMSNLLDIQAVALMKSDTCGDLCWLILRRLHSSKIWLVACDSASNLVFCKKLDTQGCVNYYFVDDLSISKNPFLIKVVDEHLKCGGRECLRKHYIESYFTIDENADMSEHKGGFVHKSGA